MPETRLIESPLRVLVNFLVDLLCLGPPRNKIRYPYSSPKRSTLSQGHVVLNYFGWPNLLKIMGYMWNMFHCFVTMKVLLRLLTIPCNILELSILKFVIISFEIMLLKEISILNMFIPIGRYIHQTTWWESILPVERWIEHHWCFKLGVGTPFDTCGAWAYD